MVDTKVEAEIQEELIEADLRNNEEVKDIVEKASAKPFLHKSQFETIYEIATGREIPVLKYLKLRALRKTDDKGNRRFSVNPVKAPARTGMICFLHKDYPLREEYSRMGLPVCERDGVPNEFEVREHMRKKHPSEWRAIERERERMEKEEDTRLRRELLDLQIAQAKQTTPEAPLYVSDKPKRGRKKKK
jgi:hypothetical protein